MRAQDASVTAGVGPGSMKFPALPSEPGPLTEGACFAVRCLGTICHLDVSGEVDALNSLELDAAIAGACRGHGGLIIVSFVDCRFVDCSCLNVLIRHSKELATRLFIIAPSASALGRIVRRARLTRTLPVHNSLRQAYLAISSDPRAALGDLAMWA